MCHASLYCVLNQSSSLRRPLWRGLWRAVPRGSMWRLKSKQNKQTKQNKQNKTNKTNKHASKQASKRTKGTILMSCKYTVIQMSLPCYAEEARARTTRGSEREQAPRSARPEWRYGAGRRGLPPPPPSTSLLPSQNDRPTAAFVRPSFLGSFSAHEARGAEKKRSNGT